MGYLLDVMQKEQGEQDEIIVLPWEIPSYETDPSDVYESHPKIIDLLQNFSDGVIYDLQRILENIFSLGQRQHIQIIGMTSAHSNEGASTIISLLSLLAAARQSSYFHVAQGRNKKQLALKAKENSPLQNILLIDTQLKHPTLHSLFSVEMQPGLNDYLKTKINLKASIKTITNSRLKLMPAGRQTDQPLYHLYFDVFTTLLEKLKPYLYFIFLDIPPLLEYAEGITLSKLCDGVILNIKSASTRWESAREAKTLLEKANVNILGAVLNRRQSYVPDWALKYI